MHKVFVLAVALLGAACEPSDEAFVAIEALTPPPSLDLGIPIRITVHGGDAVELTVVGGTLGDAEDVVCRSVRRGRSAIELVRPADVEALVIARVHAECPVEEDAVALASRQLRVAGARNDMADASDADDDATDAGPDASPIDAGEVTP